MSGLFLLLFGFTLYMGMSCPVPFLRGEYPFVKPIPFKVWFESKFTNLGADTVDSFHALLGVITAQHDLLKKVYNHNFKVKVGSIVVNGRDVLVYIGKTKSHYDVTTNRIFVSYSDDVQEIAKTILHELGHAVDPKLVSSRWVGTSAKFDGVNYPPVTDAEKAIYVKELTEFDAMGTQLSRMIKAHFEISNISDKQKMISDLKGWLRRGDDNFPYVEPDVIRKWKSKPTLWRKFQLRLWNLIQELETY
jgi:hypothetical protein